MSDPLLEIEGLTFRYRRASEPAIRDLTLTVERGEVLLVAGPSGCGKSTLIRAINGLIPHSYSGELSGSVRIDGRPTTDLRLRDIALTVGTVLQDPAKQIVGATVEAELAFGPENLGVPREEIIDRIGGVMDRAGIGNLAGRETFALSGGERQLLAVGGILMLRPTLYVVDEPLANLDPATAGRLLGMLRALADDGAAIVIVEHRVEEALDLMPDRVLYLDSGINQYLGPVDGFLRIADPHAVKLPFDVVLDRAREDARSNGAEAAPADAAESSGGIHDDGPPRLAFRDVHAGYGDRPVLRGINASFRRRETVAVLGPNGSGKTTLFRTAMRLLEPTSGTIEVDGSPIATKTVSQLATVFGYVFQSPSQMLFARTVREELAFGPRNLGRDPATFDTIIDEALGRTALADLEGIRERAPLTLSFGQQKRLALAIALCLQPPTLILDEPSAGQDHRTANGFLAAVSSIPGLESLYLITHDVDLALTHADRILLMRDGELVADGPPTDVIADQEQWTACNLRPTSLLRANAQWGERPGRLLDSETLARRIVARERAAI
ncbi:MAG TPA: ABC transporter ATP-binding protein [Candidatus Limnocylindrales bacterium]